MTTIKLGKKNVKVDFSELVNGVSQMEISDLEAFLREMSLILARKKNTVSNKELELLDIIYQPFPEIEQRHYDELQVKLKKEQLTSKEHQNLLILVEKTETRNVKWLTAMAELAEIRTVPLSELMLQLGFKNRHKLIHYSFKTESSSID